MRGSYSHEPTYTQHTYNISLSPLILLKLHKETLVSLFIAINRTDISIDGPKVIIPFDGLSPNKCSLFAKLQQGKVPPPLMLTKNGINTRRHL